MLNILTMNVKIFGGRKSKEGILEHKVIKLSLRVFLRQRIHENFTMSIDLHT